MKKRTHKKESGTLKVVLYKLSHEGHPLSLDRLLRMVLTAVTMSDCLGFNRSILFLIDEKERGL